MSIMLGSLEASAALVNLAGTQSSPLKKKIFLNNYEDDLITAVVAVLLTGMFLAYLCLCCHVWGLHMRLFQLIRSLRSGDDTNRGNGNGAQDGRPSISVPLGGRSLEDYLTPPPRYSLVNDSLPTYSCALFRMLGLMKGPVCLRIHVYVDPDVRNNSAFLDSTPTDRGTDTNLLDNINSTMNNDLNLRPSVATEVLPTAAVTNNWPPPSPYSSVVSDNPQLSDTSESLFSIPSETSSIEGTPNQSSSCDLVSVLSVATESSVENNIIRLDAMNINDCVPLTDASINSPIPSTNDVSTSISTVPNTYVDINNNSVPIHNQCSVSIEPTTSAHQSMGNADPSESDILNDNCPKSVQNISQSESTNNTSIYSMGDQHVQVHFESSVLASEPENGSPNNSIKLFLKGIGDVEQVLYALKSAPNCYVANWPLPPRDTLNSDCLEVMVDGRAVEDIYFEFLNSDGQCLGITQLHPSPRSSSAPSRYSSSVRISPFQSSSLPEHSHPPLPPPSPTFLSTLPPPYHP